MQNDLPLTQKKFSQHYSFAALFSFVGTIQRKSRRHIANSYAPKDFSSDEASSTESQTKSRNHILNH